MPLTCSTDNGNPAGGRQATQGKRQVHSYRNTHRTSRIQTTIPTVANKQPQNELSRASARVSNAVEDTHSQLTCRVDLQKHSVRLQVGFKHQQAKHAYRGLPTARVKHKQTSTGRSDLLSHFNPACAHIATRQDSMRNSNKLMYTATYKAVPIHADLQLARKPRVAAHTPPRNPDMRTCNLQGRHGWLLTHREARYTRTNNWQKSRVWLLIRP